MRTELTEESPKSNTSVECVGEGIDETGRHFAQFRVAGIDLPPIPFDSISDKDSFFSVLNAAGARIFRAASRREVLTQVEEMKRGVMFDVASRVGWHGDACFVLPGRIIGAPGRTLRVSLGHLPPEMVSKYGSEGTLDSWKAELLPLCAGNSRLIFAICLALAGALAARLEGVETTGGFQVFGEPERGKSTVGMVAGSVWGNHTRPNTSRGFLEDWNTTAAKLEDTFAAHADVGVVLDELSHFKGDVHQAVMDLASGVGRQRKNQNGRITFRAFVLSTSNAPLWAYPPSPQVHLSAALSRLTDIPVPERGFGVFESLNGKPDGAALAKALKSACLAHHGHAGPAFVAALAAKDADRYLKQAACWRRKYIKAVQRLAEKNNLKFQERPLDRFATVYAAGRLARRLSVLPWRGSTLRKAILSCHRDALLAAQPLLNGGRGADSARRSLALVKLIDYLAKERSAFLEIRSLDRWAHKFGEAKGYCATVKSRSWWYFTSKQFRTIVGGQQAAISLLALLADNSLAVKPERGLTVQRRVFRGLPGNKGWRWVVAIRSRKLSRYKKLLR